MAQKKFTLDQIESGKVGVADLEARLGGVDTAITDVAGEVDTLQTNLGTAEGEIDTLQTDLDTVESTVAGIQTDLEAKEAEIAKVNEAVMAMATAPVTTPVFNDIQVYTIQASDITGGQPTTITIPNGKSYKVGKGNLLVLRNGAPQILQNGDYTEASTTTIQYVADTLNEGDVISFIIGNPSKLNYTVAVSYYASGDHTGKIETVTYTGDIARTITYTYNTDGKIATEVIQEDGKTTTKTYTYDATSKKITGVTAVVA